MNVTNLGVRSAVMTVRRVQGLLAACCFVWGGAACGLDERASNPSCCFYECSGDRETFFSQFFGTEEECRNLATSRCEIAFEDPADQEVIRLEFQPDVELAPDAGLAATCELRFEDFRNGSN